VKITRKTYLSKKYAMTLFVMLSLLVHLTVIYVLALSGTITFSLPVHPVSETFVTLEEINAAPPKQTRKTGKVVTASNNQQASPHTAMFERGHDSAEPVVPSVHPEEHPPIQETPLAKGEQKTSEFSGEKLETAGPEKGRKKSPADGTLLGATDYERYKGPVRKAEEFLATKMEKLTYRISLLKVPVGNAVMEANNKDGELRITIRITSNAVFSAIYPVDDLVETRMIKGNYLLTRVRQSEGSYRADFGFTLMLREHQAFWVDRLTKRCNYQPLPVDDVMDAVSGFYFLRNRDLKVGKEEQLHLFDSNEYSLTTIEVLRRERIGLPGGREVDTLVVHPQFKTEGFFRRSGDIMLWLTDDEFRVPVRLETFIALGKVTAELVSAESEQGENVREKELPGRYGTETP
jgi:hypothetical protein